MNDLKVYKTNDGNYKAYVKQFKPLGKWNGKYSVSFEAFGTMDNDYRGTNDSDRNVSKCKCSRKNVWFIGFEEKR